MDTQPIFQNYEPANARAVALDHDYLAETPDDNFLKAIHVTDISREQIMEMEARTLGQSKNIVWREERTKRLPSSMFGRICKATERTDKVKLAKSLVTISNVNPCNAEFI